MRTIRTIVVDDEPAARERLVRLLSTDPEIELVTECRNGPEALEAVRLHRVDLMFLDIQMPRVSGLEVAQQLSASGQVPFMVFVTAHDRYALKAFDVNAVDYLLKPFDDDRFHLSLSRAKDYIEMRDTKRLTGRLMDLVQGHMKARQDFTEEFLIKEKGREYRVPVKDVIWFGAEGNYIVLETKARRYLVRMTMNMVESELDPGRFVRIHRSYIVNMAQVRNTRYSGNNEFTFTMSNGKHLLSGRSYKEVLAQQLAEREQE
ncbi:MAG TPA: LytTR family DNA-binding domain-containing protein [Flavobacteriales bacterium]|nr:LytTR family DNA-binding domain-containing protein [Flavobacteriales bacterium]HRO40358.1 LytTR family DNA-binding domain-containing protein [Flavobacteriales bacterium]HRQ85675.1 LytTR family DNA-binding domain-containing protein [Flavobacteriales bacterium]